MAEQIEIYTVNQYLEQTSCCGLYGALDRVNASGFSGWLVDLTGSKSSITAYAGDISVASGSLDIWRQDIADRIGLASAYGFHLYWQPWHLLHFESDTDELPLVFNYNHIRFIFSNYPNISRKQIELAKSAISKEVAARYAGIRNSPVSNLEHIEEASFVSEEDVKLIAFYTPQFYPQDENSENPANILGNWSNVATAKPFFKGHRQPQIPANGNFYDLRLVQTRLDQASLASRHGIAGFCHYYFLMNGKRVFGYPLDEILKSGRPDFPFCLCIADVGQPRIPLKPFSKSLANAKPDPDYANDLIESILPFLLDSRYIRLRDDPILLVENPQLMTNSQATAEHWRQICHKYGVPRLHLCAVTSNNNLNPYEIGFDSILLMPLSPAGSSTINHSLEGLSPFFEDRVHSYQDIVKNELVRRQSAYKTFPCVLTGWDESPLNSASGLILHCATPQLYEVWLRAAMDRAHSHLPKGERLVFINAWNDWAHGAHLEPDTEQGTALLEATKRAFAHQTDWRELLAYGLSIKNMAGVEKDALLNELGAHLYQLQLQVESYNSLYGAEPLRKDLSVIKGGKPAALAGLHLTPGGQVCFDDVNGTNNPALVVVGASQKLYCKGWSFTQGESLRPNTPTWLLLIEEQDSSIAYHGYVYQRSERGDVAKLYPDLGDETVRFSGFQQIFDMASVKNGIWQLGLLTIHGTVATIAISNVRLEVEE